MRRNLALLAAVVAWPLLGVLVRQVGPDTRWPVLVLLADLVVSGVVVAAVYTAIVDGPRALVRLVRRSA